MHETSTSKTNMVTLRTQRDQDPIAVPAFCPHFHLEVASKEQVFLYAENRQFVLNSPVYVELARAVDGVRTRDEIIRSLQEHFSTEEVETALSRLTAMGLLTALPETMLPAHAALWTSLGISPSAAGERLARWRVGVVALNKGRNAELMCSTLQSMGVPLARDAQTANALVVVVDDYLQAELDAFNRARVQDARPWTIVRSNGAVGLVGPLFRPGCSPCWACVAERMRLNRVVETFLRSGVRGSRHFHPTMAIESVEVATCHLAALEIAKGFVLDQTAPLQDRLLSINMLTLETEWHPVVQRPQCSACGRPDMLWSRGRSPSISLRPAPKPITTSGGMRTVLPESTLENLQKHISRLTGIVTNLTTLSFPGLDWLHVVVAEHHFSGINPNYHSMKHTMNYASF